MITSITDAELQEDVLRELKWEPSVDAANGVVTLTGHVSSYAEKWAAENAAKRVHGVKAVVNEIDVKLPGTSARTDEDIAMDVVNALKANISMPRDRIKVTVSKGWVTLEGEVEWQYQKIAAETAVRFIPGVVGVSNLIVVKPKVTPDQIKANIEAAFKRIADLDVRNIQVEVQGSKAILRGTVRSWAEREQAEAEAWAAPGISAVENHIIVEP
jgi:osmotically-inducible protein OsmY